MEEGVVFAGDGAEGAVREDDPRELAEAGVVEREVGDHTAEDLRQDVPGWFTRRRWRRRRDRHCRRPISIHNGTVQGARCDGSKGKYMGGSIAPVWGPGTSRIRGLGRHG